MCLLSKGLTVAHCLEASSPIRLRPTVLLNKMLLHQGLAGCEPIPRRRACMGLNLYSPSVVCGAFDTFTRVGVLFTELLHQISGSIACDAFGCLSLCALSSWLVGIGSPAKEMSRKISRRWIRENYEDRQRPYSSLPYPSLRDWQRIPQWSGNLDGREAMFKTDNDYLHNRDDPVCRRDSSYRRQQIQIIEDFTQMDCMSEDRRWNGPPITVPGQVSCSFSTIDGYLESRHLHGSGSDFSRYNLILSS
ncbi:uncharacterized protein HMPREF1120_07388 [Exophiala dermatitidis NIH/UT8656]|uniref:Uncharacterized protein n=1 Tax=Exophiala dermatitidis (strain ATCC 34100 / CBS 525.76 / NIH/UT8656) TaxID=858893 RepID=H6C6Q2_EXODN|nr:uncharacterized protein HMPREF1120_07388 [Exophiala dermatitidis NIH/UT8656]EHY59398.1 hypothetical protein HMPREF1120_07388 [Exophiala dermatitidis NIH/UT8656]